MKKNILIKYFARFDEYSGEVYVNRVLNKLKKAGDNISPQQEELFRILIVRYKNRPLFLRSIEREIEKHITRIRKAKTNKKFYSRKGRK